MPSRNTCEFVVGRLLEIRIASSFRSVADVDDMIEKMAASARTLDAPEKVVIAADWRAVTLMSPETAARAREMLAGANRRLTRSAILTMPVNPMTNLQIVRLVHEAENASRKHFTSPIVLHRWLSECLTEQESARLRAFLGITAGAA